MINRNVYNKIVTDLKRELFALKMKYQQLNLENMRLRAELTEAQQMLTEASSAMDVIEAALDERILQSDINTTLQRGVSEEKERMEEKKVSEGITIYASGIVACSVCVPHDMPREEIERLVNMESPTGISSRWAIAEDSFADGAENPHECELDTSRLHYLLHC